VKKLPSERCLITVESVLPRSREAAIPRQAIASKVTHYTYETVGHALQALVQRRRASYFGADRQRRYWRPSRTTAVSGSSTASG
jgi:hypothetical protein